MKTFKAIAATEVVARIEIDAYVLRSKYTCSNKCIAEFRLHHPEYNTCKTTVRFKGDMCIIDFVAVSDVVFEEA